MAENIEIDHGRIIRKSWLTPRNCSTVFALFGWYKAPTYADAMAERFDVKRYVEYKGWLRADPLPKKKFVRALFGFCGYPSMAGAPLSMIGDDEMISGEEANYYCDLMSGGWRGRTTLWSMFNGDITEEYDLEGVPFKEFREEDYIDN